MKTRISLLALFVFLWARTGTRVLKSRSSSSLPDLDKYFNSSEMGSALETPSKAASDDSESLDGLMEAAVDEPSPFERNLRQIPHKSQKRKSEFINLEYRNTASTRQSVKGRRIQLGRAGSKLSRRIRKLQNEVILGEMVQGIKRKAKSKHMKIKRVLLGDKVKSKFHEPNLATHLSKLLGMSRLGSHIRRAKRKLRSQKRRAKRRSRKRAAKAKQPVQPKTAAAQSDDTRKLMSMSGSSSSTGSSKGGDKDNLMKFNFLPGFAGMPFPPFMMNGPHFHPPLNVTVNSLPNPNPRAELDPKEIEEENVKTQLKALTPINERLNHVLREVDSISKETEVNLEDKFQRVVQLNS